MNSSFPNRWSFSYLKFTKYVTNIIAESKYEYGQQEQVTVRNQNRRNPRKKLVHCIRFENASGAKNRSVSFFFFFSFFFYCHHKIVYNRYLTIVVDFFLFCIFVFCFNIFLIVHIVLSFLYYLSLHGIDCTLFKTYIRRPKQAYKMQISFNKFLY